MNKSDLVTFYYHLLINYNSLIFEKTSIKVNINTFYKQGLYFVEVAKMNRKIKNSIKKFGQKYKNLIPLPSNKNFFSKNTKQSDLTLLLVLEEKNLYKKEKVLADSLKHQNFNFYFVDSKQIKHVKRVFSGRYLPMSKVVINKI